jgi:hypothetical protein
MDDAAADAADSAAAVFLHRFRSLFNAASDRLID